MFNLILRCIFFPEICMFFFVLFFPANCVNFTLSLVYQNLYFFVLHHKKNYTIFTRSLDFGQNCHKCKLFQQKKIRSLLRGMLKFKKYFDTSLATSRSPSYAVFAQVNKMYLCNKFFEIYCA